MSVPRSKRGESEMQFLHSARELAVYTIKKCVGLPKRYTFFLLLPMANCAVRVLMLLKKANSIFPTNSHEAQLRRDNLIEADGELYTLISLLEIAQEIFGLQPNVMSHWSGLIESEIRLVKALMKKDRERYKNLP